MFFKKIYSFFIAFCPLFLSTQSLQSAQIHAILVADTIDLESMETNMDMMQREVKRIAAYTHLPLNVALFEMYEVRIDNLLDYIEHLNVESDDIILFYINNHGTRLANKESIWPDLSFWMDQVLHPDHYKIDFEILHQRLAQKKPHFLLSIAEACNGVVENLEIEEEEMMAGIPKEFEQLFFGPTLKYEISSEDPLLIRLRKKTEEDVISLYQKLFLKTKGAIILSTASPGEKTMNGLFTPFFLFNLSLSLHENWEEILSFTSEMVQERFKLLYPHSFPGQHTQTIQYDLQLIDDSIQ